MSAGSLRVSICLPNLNTRPYLPERFETIFNQTFQDWELIVCDSYSDDGSWEYIQKMAAREPRMRISQTPRSGIYNGFNDCIKLARGEYIYIATSDDTMMPTCLEKLVAALDQNSKCGIAHCCLTFIDESSREVTGRQTWETLLTTRFFGEWNQKYHVRPAGHDTVVALVFKSVYQSLTQILIRRDVFKEVGLFKTCWGSFCDLEWQMRAALATSTVHLPEYLATWRIHPKQASQLDLYYKAVRDGWFLDMSKAVIEFSHARNLPKRAGLPTRLKHFNWSECVHNRMDKAKSKCHKAAILLASLLFDPQMLNVFVQRGFRRRFLGIRLNRADELKYELRLLHLEPREGQTDFGKSA